MFHNLFPKNRAVYENVEKCGTVGQVTDNNIVWCMRFEYWITKAANTRSEYVILIAFPRHRWVHEHALNVTLYVCGLSCSELTLWWLTAGRDRLEKIASFPCFQGKQGLTVSHSCPPVSYLKSRQNKQNFCFFCFVWT